MRTKIIEISSNKCYTIYIKILIYANYDKVEKTYIWYSLKLNYFSDTCTGKSDFINWNSS